LQNRSNSVLFRAPLGFFLFGATILIGSFVKSTPHTLSWRCRIATSPTASQGIPRPGLDVSPRRSANPLEVSYLLG
jgi:hypothetical protein